VRLKHSGHAASAASFTLLFATFAAAQQTTPHLTLQQAEQIALASHPQVQAARNEVAYANQLITETRSAYFPTLAADLTGSQASHDARIGAGFLSDSALFNRYGNGFSVNQLITDSGRTNNLVASSRLNAQAGAQNLEATRYDVLLAVNRAYFDVLRAQATVRVASETIAERQVLDKQVTTLAENNLRSQLDVSFADVNVSEARLLLIRAQNSLDQAWAELARALGADQVVRYELDEVPMPAAPPSAPDDLVTQAIAGRPELASLRASRDSAYKFAEAEKDLKRPIVSAVAVGGYIPYIEQISSTRIPGVYEGAAVNVNIPVFNGRLFTAREEAARQRALESDQRLRDEQQRLTRDVRVAWADAATAYQRIDVTAQFMRQAALALTLAQGRYDLGLSSIVELAQAQLNQTQAEIENVTAKYDYQTRYAVLQYAIGQLR